MKLSIEKHPELVKLAGYFKKIEAIAEKMGIDVDDLVQEKKFRSSSMYTSFKKNIMSIAQKRADVLSNRHRGSSPEEASIVGLTIMVNDHRDQSEY